MNSLKPEKSSHRHRHRDPLSRYGRNLFLVLLGVSLISVVVSLFSSGFIQRQFLKRSLVPAILPASPAAPLLEASFSELSGESLPWRGVTFKVQNLYSSCKNPDRSAEMALTEKPSKNLYFMTAGCQFTSKEVRPVLELTVRYVNGSWEKKIIRANQDVWPLNAAENETVVPPSFLVWKGIEGQSATALVIPLDPSKTPRSLELRSLGSPDDPGAIFFSAVQEKDHF